MRRVATRGFARLALTVVLVMAFCVPGVSAAQEAPLIATGVITDAVSGLPIEDARVYAIWCPDDDMRITVGWADTDANGAYELSLSHQGQDTYSGKYEISAQASTYKTAYQQVTWDGSTPLAVDIALAPAKVIAHGMVTDLISGYPLESEHVMAFAASGGVEAIPGMGLAAVAYTASDGTYVLYDERGFGSGDFVFAVQPWAGYIWTEHDATWDGETPLEIDFAMRPLSDTYIAVEGPDRFATAIAASTLAYPEGLAEGGAKTVVIASGMNWPDALGGTALAGALDGPVLLTQTGALPPGLIAEIRRLNAEKAVILGGTKAVGTAVKAALEAELGAGTVERIGGADRYETANMVALKVIELRGGDYDGTAFVTTGANFPDALAAAPLAARQGWPFFLVGPAGPSESTVAAMADVTDVLVLGGPSAVGSETEATLKARFGDEDVNRLWGADRYATAIAIATYAVDHAGHEWDRVGIATGVNFPDALTGGVLQGKVGSVTLLVPTVDEFMFMFPDIRDFLSNLRSAEQTLAADLVYAALVEHREHIDRVTFFGGRTAVSRGVRAAVLRSIGYLYGGTWLLESGASQ